MGVEKTAFISYRRTNIYMARAVYQDLTAHGYDCFLDFESIDAGSFERIILNQIAAKAHFIVVLTPSALERCSEPNDWLRREIEYALEMKRNIVPLMFDRFSFDDVQQYLVGKLTVLPQYNALNIPPDYFEAAMDKLRERFLSKSLDMILHPTPQTDVAAVQAAQANEAVQSVVTEAQLTAEQWFERGLKRDKNDYDGQVADYTEAIRLNPQYANAYSNRGVSRYDKGDVDGAFTDYSEAIRLNPKLTNAHTGLGDCYYRRKQWQEALNAYEKCLALPPGTESRGALRKRVEELRRKVK